MSLALSIQSFAEFVILALAILAHVLIHRRAGKDLSVSSVVWATLPALLLLFLGIWGQMGLLEGPSDSSSAQLSLLIIGICGIVSLLRNRIWSLCEKLPVPARIALGAALAIVILVLPLFIIETPYNNLMTESLPSHAWLEALICGLVLVALYFLGQRHAWTCTFGIAAFALIGIAQYFIKTFKNAAILPTDLYALGTAAAVSNEYVFSLNEFALRGLAYTALAICALSLVRPPEPALTTSARKRSVAINTSAGVLSFCLLVAVVTIPSYMGQLGLKMEYWYTIDYYMKQGFIPTFVAVQQDMPIHVPNGYSDQEASEILAAHAEHYRTTAASSEEHAKTTGQFDHLRPTVIAIMNESFCDMSIFDDLQAGYKGPEYFKNGLNDTLLRGRLNVSAYGGGTCNSEFEFLTGNSISFVGAGKYPYSIYDFAKVDALPNNFKNLGYTTTAIHPNYPSNWNRDEIYKHMGFDTFLSIDDFGGVPDCEVDKVTPNEPHSEVFHSGVSDKATYDRVLQLLKDNESPQFIFDITMANHGSYDQKNFSAKYALDYHPANYDGEIEDEFLNEYLSCIKRSDEDLKDFIAQLRELDRPVVLVFFGDHQPGFSWTYNDLWYANEPEDVHARRIYCTNYVVWANYDVGGYAPKNADEEISLDMLAARTLDAIGAPTTDYQAAQLDIRNSIRALSTKSYLGADNKWYTFGSDSAYTKDYDDLAKIEYLNFATKVV